MADETANSLREMAQHRGLKLLRSRRRKPGTGDFGKFGLTDDKGKPLLGISEDGLTAGAEDIESYLRAGAASTWQQSAKITPDRPASRLKRERDDPADEDAVPRRGARSDAPADSADRRSRASPAPPTRAAEEASAAKRQDATRARAPASRGRADAAKAAQKARDKAASAKPEPRPVEVAPTLVLREAKPADAAALAKLLSQLNELSPSSGDVARDLAALRKAGASVHLAELRALIGCAAWSVVPTLQRGPVGRVTMLVVDEDHRRQGIGTQLLAVAEAALAKKGCTLVEVMSDIELKNSHNFFRTLKFEQTSYRFARKIAG